MPSLSFSRGAAPAGQWVSRWFLLEALLPRRCCLAAAGVAGVPVVWCVSSSPLYPVTRYQELTAVVVYTLNRSFYPTTSAVPPSVLPDSSSLIQILWSQDSETEKPNVPKESR